MRAHRLIERACQRLSAFAPVSTNSRPVRTPAGSLSYRLVKPAGSCREATTGIEPVDRSNRTVEPNIDVLLLLLMLKRRWRL